MTTYIITLLVGFAGGFYAGMKNANSQKIAKAKQIIEDLKK
jgi:uncharacterized protein YneF (UPF0154 family)